MPRWRFWVMLLLVVPYPLVVRMGPMRCSRNRTGPVRTTPFPSQRRDLLI